MLNELFERYPALQICEKDIEDALKLLIDTYNFLKSGLPNAIKAFDEVLKPLGKRPKGVRIDSGDITYLSKKCRKALDEAGYPDCKIVASNSLDENIIRDMLIQGAKVDSFGVGERLITAMSCPVLGGVDKLCGVEIIDAAIENAKINMELNNIKNAEFVCNKAEDQIIKWSKSRMKPTVIVVDPPRKGCEGDFLKTVVEMNIPKIVYVSCDVSTLARDMKYLVENGYKPGPVQPVDMFPHTEHVETVCLLTKIL